MMSLLPEDRQRCQKSLKYIEQYPIQASNKVLMEILSMRIRQQNICHSVFAEKSFCQFPYSFEDKDRYSYIIAEEKKLLDRVVRFKFGEFITIKKVQSFETKEVKEFWIVDSKRMVIVGNKKNVPSAVETEELIGNYFKNPQKYPEPMNELFFGRNTGLGKLIHFDARDISRPHFKIKRSKNYQNTQKAKVTTLLCLKNSHRSSLWACLTPEIENCIMDFLFKKKQVPYEIQDYRSKLGTFLNLGNNFQLSCSLPILSLTQKSEITLKVLDVMEAEIKNKEEHMIYKEKINEFLSHLDQNQQSFPICFRPNYWQDYFLIKDTLDFKQKNRNQKDPLFLSTIIMKVLLPDQVRYFVVNNCSNSYRMVNGPSDLELINPYCEKNRELIRIYFQDSKWKAEGSKQGLETKLLKNVSFNVTESQRVRLGKNTKLIIDLPKYL